MTNVGQGMVEIRSSRASADFAVVFRSAMDSFRFTTDHLPLVVITCPRRMEPTDTVRFLEAYTRDVLEREGRFAVVVDATTVTEIPSALVRRHFTEWMPKVERLGIESLVGMSMATSSAIVRGAATAIWWVVPPKIPMSTEATLLESVDWALAKLDASAVAIPTAVRGYRERIAREGRSPRATGIDPYR